jgi:hypothetical protein
MLLKAQYLLLLAFTSSAIVSALPQSFVEANPQVFNGREDYDTFEARDVHSIESRSIVIIRTSWRSFRQVWYRLCK